MRTTGVTALLVDTAPRPHALAERLAAAMDALYLPLVRVAGPAHLLHLFAAEPHEVLPVRA